MKQEKIDKAWKVLKNEITKEQFDALIHYADKLGKKKWRFSTAWKEGNALVLELWDNKPYMRHKHWFKIQENGDAAFMPTFMDVR